ncbi:MAG: hypothetical protein ACRD37_01020, partial [Candidatus Acidiferrales bacterium]
MRKGMNKQRLRIRDVPATVALLCGCVTMGLGAAHQGKRGTADPPTFYKDVAPILQQHCQACHRAGEIAPMPLVTYGETRRYAREIKDRVTRRIMPPWFADPCCGHFANDPLLTRGQIATLAAWADAGAPEGNPHDAPPPRQWASGWIIPRPDDVVRMPEA